MIFKRKNKTAVTEAQSGQTIAELNAAASQDREPEAAGTAAPEAANTAEVRDNAPAASKQNPDEGPFDGDSIEDHSEYLDMGALLIKPVPGLQLRLEVEESTQRVIAVALELGGSRMQLQVFAAPKSDLLWPGISTQIATGIADQGGETEMVPGRFGNELLARVPQTAPDGRQGYVVLRFLGIDGPRWFLRAVIGGAALTDPEESKAMEEALAQIVVVRGDTPMPPTELLPLTVPKGALTRPESGAETPGTERPERGPEITQIG